MNFSTQLRPIDATRPVAPVAVPLPGEAMRSVTDFANVQTLIAKNSEVAER
jgi:hypothetical protein